MDINIISTSLEQKTCIWDALCDSSTLLNTRQMLSEKYFDTEYYAAIWRRIQDAWDAGQVVDPITIMDAAEYVKLCGEMGSSNYVTDMTAVAHASALRSAHIRRSIQMQCFDLATKLGSGADEDIMLNTVKGMENELVGAFDQRAGVSTMSEAINALATQLETERRNREEGRSTVVPTGFEELDYACYGGFRGGNLVVLAARPAVGKSSVALQMVRAAAASGKKVMIFSLEMKDDEIAKKMQYAVGGLTAREVATLDIDWSKFDKAAATLCGYDVTIDYQTSNIDEIIAKITMARQQGRCDLAVIDHLGLTTVSGRNVSTYQAMNERTRKLKQLAMASDIPILALCQLNRASVQETREPELQDLRDSGSIEQDADKVIMLDNGLEGEERTLRMYIRKNRQGRAPRGFLEYRPNDTYSEFTPM